MRAKQQAEDPANFEPWLQETYAAVFDAAAFQRQLYRLAGSFRCHAVALQIECPDQRGMLFVEGLPKDHFERYADYENLWVIKGAGRLLSDGIAHDAQFMSLKEMTRSAYHADVLRPLELDHSLALLTNRIDHSGIIFLSLTRSRKVGAFEKEEVRTLRALRPHLKTAISLHMEAQGLNRELSTYRELVEASRDPVLVLDGANRIRHWNAAADDLLVKADAIGRRPNGTLLVFDKRSRRKLSGALHRGRDARVPIHDAQGRPWALVDVRCLETALEFNAGQPAYSLRLTLLDTVPEGDWRALRGLYGLTRKESQLALSLAGTFSLRDTAKELDITYETARTHLKAVLGKAHAVNQAELIARVRATSRPKG